MTERENQLKAALPPLTMEQVETITTYLKACEYEDRIDWGNQCCASDTVSDAVTALCDKLREAYGAVLKPINEDEDSEDEDSE